MCLERLISACLGMASDANNVGDRESRAQSVGIVENATGELMLVLRD